MSVDNKLSDSKLMILLLNKPEKGIEKLMDIYAGLVYTIVYSKLSNVGAKEDIEDCVSDIFYELYKNLNSIDLQKGSIKAYLSIISKRKAIDLFRKLSRTTHETLSIDEMDYDSIPAENSDVEDVVIYNETKEKLIEEIKKLGEPDGEIFIRKYFFGQSTKIIAVELNLKENTVDKKVSRGLGKLKISMEGVL